MSRHVSFAEGNAVLKVSKSEESIQFQTESWKYTASLDSYKYSTGNSKAGSQIKLEVNKSYHSSR